MTANPDTTIIGNHLQHRDKMNAAKLSKTVWCAKEAGENPQIRWSIAAQLFSYQPGAKSCNLCLLEKLAILNADPATTIRTRSQFIAKCTYKINSNSKEQKCSKTFIPFYSIEPVENS